MPVPQTRGQTYLPLPKCYMGKDMRCLKLQDGHRVQANEVNMMFFSKQQGHGKKIKAIQNLIKALNLRHISRCRADFHANLETQASFTAQLRQNLINRILQGAEFYQISWELHSASFPTTLIDSIYCLQNAFLNVSLGPGQQMQDCGRGLLRNFRPVVPLAVMVSGMLCPSHWPLYGATCPALWSPSVTGLGIEILYLILITRWVFLSSFY